MFLVLIDKQEEKGKKKKQEERQKNRHRFRLRPKQERFSELVQSIIIYEDGFI